VFLLKNVIFANFTWIATCFHSFLNVGFIYTVFSIHTFRFVIKQAYQVDENEINVLCKYKQIMKFLY